MDFPLAAPVAEAIGAALADELPEITWRPPQATYLAWLDRAGLGLGDEPAAELLARGRVAMGRGRDFGPPGAGLVRLNFATSPEHLADAVDRIASVRSADQLNSTK